jgi:hypothetical protein
VRQSVMRYRRTGLNISNFLFSSRTIISVDYSLMQAVGRAFGVRIALCSQRAVTFLCHWPTEDWNQDSSVLTGSIFNLQWTLFAPGAKRLRVALSTSTSFPTKYSFYQFESMRTVNSADCCADSCDFVPRKSFFFMLVTYLIHCFSKCDPRRSTRCFSVLYSP